LKKSVLELGGSDPFVVLDDADVESAAKTGATARTINAGQSCIAAKRFVVHTDVYDEWLDAFLAEMDDLTVGDPTDDETDLGPQAREDLMEDLHEQVQRTVEEGATLELGGEPLDREGFYYPPTVLTDVPRDSVAACEEVFGPAAAVFEVESEEEAIELANATDYGLVAGVYTENVGRAHRFAREVDAGQIYINEYFAGGNETPFGGFKDSGIGRENGVQAIDNYTQVKNICANIGRR